MLDAWEWLEKKMPGMLIGEHGSWNYQREDHIAIFNKRVTSLKVVNRLYP